ncbi:substrate-binding domain-containing protein [Kribbella italica]|uniref:DNA-binding LacI/PurR family transcriptional regulator n=1 Tax=Kribbella italica TaxID=1540520 RepID=A0A7W9J5H7_9ACTN|nr:DNA-binding LacI/PurR family transcriptional regulator [Kribbella italica]
MSTVGFVFVRQVGAPRFEAFFNEILSGLEAVLVPAGTELLVQTVEDTAQELAVYHHWHTTGVVEAVVLKDIRDDDDRIHQLTELGLPFVLLADVTQTGEYAALRSDNAQAMRDSVAFFARRGHRVVARVSGPASLVHSQIRTEAGREEAARTELRITVAEGDYSTQSGYDATEELLALTPRPTAIVYDNDLMALGGLEAATQAGVAVPDDLSILAWDDSVACQLVVPTVSALSHDVQEMGEQLGQALLALTQDHRALSLQASQPVIVERESTAGPEAMPKDAADRALDTAG